MRNTSFILLPLLFLSSCSDKYDDFLGGSDGGIKTTVTGIVINPATQKTIANYPIEIQEETVCFLCPGNGRLTFARTKTDNEGKFSYTFYTLAHKSYSVKASSDTLYTCLFNYSVPEGGSSFKTIEVHKTGIVKVSLRNKTQKLKNEDISSLRFQSVYQYDPSLGNILGHQGLSLTDDENPYIDMDRVGFTDSATIFVYLLKGIKFRASLGFYSSQKDTSLNKTFTTAISDTTYLTFDF